MKTIGKSPKVIAATIIAAGVQVLGVVASFLANNASFTTLTWIQLSAAVLTVIGGYVAGYAAPPGQVTDDPNAPEPPHPELAVAPAPPVPVAAPPAPPTPPPAPVPEPAQPATPPAPPPPAQQPPSGP